MPCAVLCLAAFFLMARAGALYQAAEGPVVDKVIAATGFFTSILSRPFWVPTDTMPLLWGLLGAVAALLAVYYYTYCRHNLMPGKEHGSAAWGTPEDIKPFVDPVPEHNILLTASEKLSMASHMKVTDTEDYNRNKNVLIIGGSGSRKTRGYIKPNIMQMDGNYIITDPKGELLSDCGTALIKNGYTVKIFNLKDRDQSDHYNLFAYLHNEDDVLKIAKNLIANMKDDPTMKTSSDPLWEEGMTGLIEALICYVREELSPIEQNMNSVMELFRLLVIKEDDTNYVSPLDIVFQELEARKPDAFALKQYQIYKMAAPKTAQSINVSLGMRLSAFNIPSITKLVADDTLALDELALDRKVALFIVLPDTTKAFNFLAAVMYQQLFDMLVLMADARPTKQLPRPCRCMLDEFANIGKIPDFDILISTIRSRDISVNIVYQSLAQLKSQYEKVWVTIMENCDSWLFLGGSGTPDNLEFESKLLGKTTIEIMNTSESKGSQGSFTKSYQSLARDLMTPDEIRRLPRGECLLIVSGLPAFRSRKYDLTKHPNYQLLGDTSPENVFDFSKRNDYTSAAFFMGVEKVSTLDLSELNNL